MWELEREGKREQNKYSKWIQMQNYVHMTRAEKVRHASIQIEAGEEKEIKI